MARLRARGLVVIGGSMLAGFLFGLCLGGAVFFFFGVAYGIREEQESELQRQSRIARKYRRAGSVEPPPEFAFGRLRREGRG